MVLGFLKDHHGPGRAHAALSHRPAHCCTWLAMPGPKFFQDPRAASHTADKPTNMTPAALGSPKAGRTQKWVHGLFGDGQQVHHFVSGRGPKGEL